MTALAPPVRTEDRAASALLMMFCALFLGWATDVKGGEYSPLALFLLTIGITFCLAAIAFRPGQDAEGFLHKRFTAILAVTVFLSTLISTGILVYLIGNDRGITIPLLFLAALCLLLTVNLPPRRLPLLVAVVIAFCFVSTMTFLSPLRDKYSNIDVLLFQQSSADALWHGHNPYAIRFPNIYSTPNSAVFQAPLRYGPGTPFYGPGVVDAKGWITYGFPYPPLSLLMVMPAYLLGGDSRFALVIAIGLSALMMATARPGRWGTLVALLFLFRPQGFFVIDKSWTEPLVIFTFSLAMFCACRWRKGLPWALGLFFASKQYTVLALPALLLLLDGPNPVKRILEMAAKAGVVVAAINLPFLVWNPHEFIRAVVQFQFVQPFRADSLSYLVWIYNHNGGQKLPMWTPFLVILPAVFIAIRRCPRSPAGFAAAVTLIYLMFFAFSKQAFSNYYYFVIGTAFWSVAAMQPLSDIGWSKITESLGNGAEVHGLLPDDSRSI